MASTFTNFSNQSYLAMQTQMQNFTPVLSAQLTTSGTSASVTFTPLISSTRTSFKITNKGTKGAYIAWGKTTATAVASSVTPAPQCDYVAAGAILTQDFQLPVGTEGIVDTIAAIQGSDTQDNAPTILEITYGFGQ